MEIWSSARTQKLWIDGTRRQMSGQCEGMELLRVGLYGCAWQATQAMDGIGIGIGIGIGLMDGRYVPCMYLGCYVRTEYRFQG